MKYLVIALLCLLTLGAYANISHYTTLILSSKPRQKPGCFSDANIEYVCRIDGAGKELRFEEMICVADLVAQQYERGCR